MGRLSPTDVSSDVVLQLLLLAFVTENPGEMFQQPSTRGKAALGGRESAAFLKLYEMWWEPTARET